jgi:hypothetical protein
MEYLDPFDKKGRQKYKFSCSDFSDLMEGIGIHATYFWTITGLKGRTKYQDR